MPNELRIIPAEPAHVPLVLQFIHELAEYEKLTDSVVATEELLHESLFGATPKVDAVLAYWADEPAGFALFFHNFSTCLGRPGLYLEDLFVRPAYRGKGIGQTMMRHLAKLAVERKCGRFEWSVLDWNEKAIHFYESLGAEAMSDWTVYRVTGDALERLADGDS
ncbi:MAG: GNAT family N-acetyltransferase [Planctomycetes bacterium]|nr:GNAT family N-acetyltransferase [Planctomycetota bacterium]